VDKVGVTIVHPPIYIYLTFVITLLLLAPYVFFKERLNLKKEWNINKIKILIVGFLGSIHLLDDPICAADQQSVLCSCCSGGKHPFFSRLFCSMNRKEIV